MSYKMRRNPLASIFPSLDQKYRWKIDLRMSKRRCSSRWHLAIFLRAHLQEWQHNFSVTTEYICVAHLLSVTPQGMDSWLVPQQRIKWRVINKDCSMDFLINCISLLWWLIWRMRHKTYNQITMIWIGNLLCNRWRLSWHGRNYSNMPKMNLLRISSTIWCGPLLHSGRLSVPLHNDCKSLSTRKTILGRWRIISKSVT